MLALLSDTEELRSCRVGAGSIEVCSPVRVLLTVVTQNNRNFWPFAP